MNSPLVTTIIDTYNHEKFIEKAIRSVLEQELDGYNLEIIVIDDGSTDNTPEIIKNFIPRVRYIRKNNGGQATAFNVSIPEAQGEIIAFLDGDDWWAKNKLKTVLEVLAQKPEIGAVGHGIIEMYADGKEHLVAASQPWEIHLQNKSSALIFRDIKCLLGTSRFTARKAILAQILPIPEQLTVEADEYMFTIAATLSPVVVIQQALTYYRLHGGNLYQIQNYDRTKLWRKYQVLAGLIQNLPPKLTELGLHKEVIDILIAPIWVEAERLRLSMQGGTPWQTFIVEQAAYNLSQGKGNKIKTLKHYLFKNLVFALALLMAPQLFYQIRSKYAAINNSQKKTLDKTQTFINLTDS